MTKSRLNFNLNRACKWCNDLFYSTDLRRKYCSEFCSEKAAAFQRKEYCKNWYQKHKKYLSMKRKWKKELQKTKANQILIQ